jgi:aspartate kinase
LSITPTIMKFGGTSVEDATAFARVAQIVKERQELQPVIVVSAMRGMTDALLASMQFAAEGDHAAAVALLEKNLARHADVANSLLPEASITRLLLLIENCRAELADLLRSIDGNSDRRKLQDQVLAYGEQLSSALLAGVLNEVLQENSISAREVDARTCIVTNSEYGSATPLMPETFRQTRLQLEPLLAEGVMPVLGGFIGADAQGQTTTLGRGGSDYSAALIGAALSAREIQIWTDVNGVLTADPNLVPNARPIPQLSYAEAAELAYFGAKVLHPKTIQPAVEGDIPVRICNSRAPHEPGTLVCAENEESPRGVKAIAHKAGVTTIQITSARMLGAYGFLRALFEIFDRHRTVVDVVTTSEVSVSLSLDDAGSLTSVVEELEQLGAVRVEKGRAIICVVGAGLRGTPGIAARVFSTISDINVNLISQGASSVNLTLAVEEQHVNEAVSRLHQEFFEREKEQATPASKQ